MFLPWQCSYKVFSYKTTNKNAYKTNTGVNKQKIKQKRYESQRRGILSCHNICMVYDCIDVKKWNKKEKKWIKSTSGCVEVADVPPIAINMVTAWVPHLFKTRYDADTYRPSVECITVVDVTGL